MLHTFTDHANLGNTEQGPGGQDFWPLNPQNHRNFHN